MDKVDGVLKKKHTDIGLSMEKDERSIYLIKNDEIWAIFSPTIGDDIILSEADRFTKWYDESDCTETAIELQNKSIEEGLM